ncbi:GNAT family N-acetyltransferase [Leptolyngbya ohadii]|uniref:GNAT family N-acetyltransferase n=1 Tax=Leptolyngbya ohadii TaxID=1962290 RepID=UPI000B59DE11|nr:GNAT family N-acetyltransferase [Leptolyngbya ohadii]
MFWLLSLGITVLLLAIVALVTAFLWLRLSPLLSDDWKYYWVIVDCFSAAPRRKGQTQLIACAKLCRYRHYSLLFNLLVAPAYRQQGLGSMLVKSIGEKAVKPLYLACSTDRVSFYTRLGFEPVAAKELTAIVRNELGIMPQSRLLVLKLD